MNTASRGLGKGLGALIKDISEASQGDPGVRKIPVAKIVPNPFQPRQHFSKEALEDLAQSIQSQGVLQPILVRPGRNKDEFELIAGERRWRASQLAKLTEIPALIKEINDEESIAIALIENLQREDLNPLEEAQALHNLKERFQLKQEELSEKIGKSRSAVANSLRLLQLPKQIQEDLSSARISSGHARAILSVSEESAQIELSKMIYRDGLTVRQTEDIAAQWKSQGGFQKKILSPTKTPIQQDESIHEIVSQIQKELHLKASIKGSKEKGALSLYYGTQKELIAILHHLGIK